MAIEVLLSDLDGVIRHFEAGHRDACEDRHGLARGTLWSTAFAPELAERVITGKLTMAQWHEAVAAAIGSMDPVREWFEHRGAIDAEMLALVDRLRAGGTTVAVLTNGTDTIEAELRGFGVFDRFDRVFSSWEIGFAKPDPRAFRHVVEALDVDPATVFFADDTESKLPGAVSLGMTAHHFTSVTALTDALVAAGLSHAAGS